MKAILKQTGPAVALKAGVLAVAMFAAAGASAQTAGSWMGKIGYNQISPKVTSGDLSAPALPGSKTDVGSDAEPIFTGTYMFTDHISAELFLGIPYTHDMYAAGSIRGVGKIGRVQQLPPTLFAQYRFMEPTSSVRPYIGLGVTYAMFRKPEGTGALTALTNPGGTPTTFNVDNGWGITPQIGLTWNFSGKWFADIAITKTYISTTAHLSTGQHADLRLDPVATAVAVGYRF